MKRSEIRSAVACAKREIEQAKLALDAAVFRLQQLQKSCPHEDRKRWTNNDGDGQFIVERCEICGLQRDGGLGMRP